MTEPVFTAQHVAELVAAVLDDPNVVNTPYAQVAYVARFSDEETNEFGFWYDKDGVGHYFEPSSDTAFTILDNFNKTADHPFRVAVLKVSIPADSITLRTYHGTDADPWFVPLGEEESLAQRAFLSHTD